MVTSRNVIIAGLALVVGFIVLRGFNNTASIGASITPTVENIPTENPQIKILNDAIKGVQGFITRTFKTPILTKGLTTGGKTLPCRGPNCLGSFQARGTVSGFDPFTGRRVALAGSQVFQNITGTSAGQFALNQQRITQGAALSSQANQILLDLQNQLKILQTNTV